MRLRDLVGFAATALWRHRLRTGLSLLGVAIGVLAVVGLTALGEGARRYVVNQFANLGTNLLIVIPGRTETTGALPGVGGVPNDLTLEDAAALRRQLAGAKRVVPVVVGSETVSAPDRSRQVPIIGSTEGFRHARRLDIGSGRFLPVIEDERATSVVVLGANLAKELFPTESAVGRVVRIGGWRMRVIGTTSSRGTSLGMDLDDMAIVPVATAMRMLNRSSLFRVLIEVKPNASIEQTRESVLAILADRHDEKDVTCLTQDSVLSGFSSILTALTIALASIAAISLGVAGVGIMNVMLVSVSERTEEVGLLKALGARNRQVLACFLVEAVLLSTSGGLVGLATAYGAQQLVAWAYPTFPIAAPLWAVLAALGVSVGTGALFGVLPASRAMRLDPVQALVGR